MTRQSQYIVIVEVCRPTAWQITRTAAYGPLSKDDMLTFSQNLTPHSAVTSVVGYPLTPVESGGLDR